MMLSKISIYSEKGFKFFFPLFLFFSAIFCNYTRVNNIFHLSALCLLGMLAGNPTLRRQLFNDRRFNTGLSLSALMLGYFCLTTIWSAQPQELISELIHALYLILFIIMYKSMAIRGHRLITLWAVTAGMTVLVALTFFTVNAQTILSNRLNNGFFGAPTNVIDLAGYFTLGIFMCLIIIRDTNTRWLYLPITLLFLGLLFTQSRGPLLSLIYALCVLLITLRLSIRMRHIIAMVLIGVTGLALLFVSHFSDILLQRITSGYQQSFIRFDIWHHTLILAAQKPFFGWGLKKQLSFINLLGDNITTPHSLYLAALLKGGMIGVLLLTLVISYGFIIAKRQCEYHQELEAALFLFITGFHFTHGMFIISNPNVTWFMFWFPLAIVLSSTGTAENDIQDNVPTISDDIDNTATRSCQPPGFEASQTARPDRDKADQQQAYP